MPPGVALIKGGRSGIIVSPHHHVPSMLADLIEHGGEHEADPLADHLIPICWGIHIQEAHKPAIDGHREGHGSIAWHKTPCRVAAVGMVYLGEM